MNELDYAPVTPIPTAMRPLLGSTILVVEDSRFACDALRLLCLRSGARIRRADCLRSARRHLQVYRPSVVIVDQGLPDGLGTDLIHELSSAEPRIASMIGTSGDDMNEAVFLAAGADGFLSKPLASLAKFQAVVLKAMPVEMRPLGLRQITDEVVDPDPLAFCDDMAHASEMLSSDSDSNTLDYIAQFVQGVAKSARDEQLTSAARKFVQARASGGTINSHHARLAGLVRERMTAQFAI